MKLLVNVTQDDIDLGVAGNCYGCPIARALNWALEGAGYRDMVPSVYHDRIRIASRCTVPLPETAKEFIKDFDRCAKNLKPFSFEIDIPSFEIDLPLD